MQYCLLGELREEGGELLRGDDAGIGEVFEFLAFRQNLGQDAR